MKLLFKQKMFSWFDSYDIYDENGNKYFTVKGKPSIGHKLLIYNKNDEHIATLKEHFITFLPKFDMYVGNDLVGSIRRELKFLRPSYKIDYNGWRVDGNFFEFNYEIKDDYGNTVAIISKQLMNFTDTYVIDIYYEKDALYALMAVLAIDAAKDTLSKRSSN